MKLDTRTLPAGYRLTSENPRVVRLTRGKTTKVNFGAVGSRVVRLDLRADAFVDGSTALRPRWRDGLGGLIGVLQREPSLLRITYRSTRRDRTIAKARAREVARAVRQGWKRARGSYALTIERRVVGADR